MIRVADYIARALARQGIRHVFLVTGGAAMHLNDAFGRCRDLECLPLHHEQACTMAADSYYRLTNRLAAVNVTAGPGGTNALTGVFGAYVDSLGMVVVSGQSRFETLVASTSLPLRQLGDQEVDVVRMVAGITKYAVLVTDPHSIRYHIERAVHLARSGRPGPVWLDVPVNVQGTLVDEAALPGYDPRQDAPAFETDLPAACREIVARLREARRPVVLAGSGVRLSGAHREFLRLVEAWGVPVATGWNAHDVLADDHPCYAGRPGTVGDRAGNFVVQNADFLLVLGCRLNIRQVSYAWKTFARAAFLAMIDVDAAELRKPTVRPALPVHADLVEALPALRAAGFDGPTPEQRRWLAWCKERVRRFPVCLPEYWDGPADGVNPYCFVDALFRELPDDQVVVTGDGTACVTTFQAARLRPGMRLYTNSGCASMGYDLPAAIGAHVATGRPVVCLAGDGSIMMNLQELATIAGRALPVKIFLLNNQGYHSIRQTQRNFFPDNVVGCGSDSGLCFPDFGRLSEGFGLPFRRCARHAELGPAIRATLDGGGPQVCEVMLDLAQPFAPKLASKRLPDGRMVTAPLEDMTPLLDRREFADNMIIPPVPE